MTASKFLGLGGGYRGALLCISKVLFLSPGLQVAEW